MVAYVDPQGRGWTETPLRRTIREALAVDDRPTVAAIIERHPALSGRQVRGYVSVLVGMRVVALDEAGCLIRGSEYPEWASHQPRTRPYGNRREYRLRWARYRERGRAPQRKHPTLETTLAPPLEYQTRACAPLVEDVDPILSIGDVGKVLRIGHTAAAALVRSGELRGIVLAGRPVVLYSVLVRYVRSLKERCRAN